MFKKQSLKNDTQAVFWKLYFIFGQEKVTPSDAVPINQSVTLNSIRLNHNILFDNGTHLITMMWSSLSDGW